MSTRSAGFACQSMRDRDASLEETVSRSRVPRIVGAVALACLCACSGDPRRDLVKQAETELAVDGTASPNFNRPVSAGTYLVEVREVEINLRVLVDGGGTHLELSDQVPRHGAIYALLRMPADGELRVQLRSADHPTKQGRGHLVLMRWKDDDRAQASELERSYASFSDAGAQCALNTPQGYARAADKLYEAVSHFAAAHDAPGRAQAAYSLASIQYNVRDEWAASVRAAEIAIEAYEAADDETGIQSAMTLRAAAEINVAAGMDSGTHGAEQKALYASADRRLADAAEYFSGHGLPVRAAYALNMRAVGAGNVGDYATAKSCSSRLCLYRGPITTWRKRLVHSAILPRSTICVATWHRRRASTRHCCRSSIASRTNTPCSWATMASH